MRRFSALAVSALVLATAACGGDDGSPQSAAADLFLDLADQIDLDLNADCINDEFAGLSDSDAQALVDAGLDGDPELSEAGNEIMDGLTSCADLGNYIDSIVAQFEDDESVDTDCLREGLEALGSVAEVDDQAIDVALSC